MVGLQLTNEASGEGHYSCSWGGSWTCDVVAAEHGSGSGVSDIAEAEEETHGHTEVDHIDCATARALGTAAGDE